MPNSKKLSMPSRVWTIVQANMSRLFEDAGKQQKRKWQCFVCGKQYTEFQDYKNHIITEHEEGREYISCPSCKAPVRDLKSHYRIKHPKRAMPKNTQQTVAVWKDFAPGGKKKKTKKPTFQKGYFESKKMNGALFYYRSGYERDIYSLLEEDADVAAYYAEPFKIPYHFKGGWHNYIPDIKIHYIDNSIEIWEIKPASQTHYEVNNAKWAAAKNYTENVGWDFKVITEVGKGKLQAKIKRQRQRKK